jgi:hypothetical protein
LVAFAWVSSKPSFSALSLCSAFGAAEGASRTTGRKGATVIVTKWQLFDSMVNRRAIGLTLKNGKGEFSASGVVNDITAEDGSGSKFIVTLDTGATGFLCTTD